MATAAFLAVVGFVVFAAVAAVVVSTHPDQRGRALQRSILLASGWLIVTSLPTLTGVLRAGGPVPAQVFMVLFLVVAVWFGGGPVGGRIAVAVPLWVIVGFQGFRLPLELVLHEWVAMGVAPPQMTWGFQPASASQATWVARNWDIVAGIVAILSAPIVRRWKRFAWAPTLIGSVLLLNVIWIVGQSLPGPLYAFTEPITLPFRFPHVWIASVCVTGAVAGHIIAFRALFRLVRA